MLHMWLNWWTNKPNQTRQSTRRVVTSMHVLFIPDISALLSVLMGLTGILFDDGFSNENYCHILISLIFLDFWEQLAWFSISYRTRKNYLYTSFILEPITMRSFLVLLTNNRVCFIAWCTWGYACTCSAGNQQKPCE
jgi:hypothetical protein